LAVIAELDILLKKRAEGETLGPFVLYREFDYFLVLDPSNNIYIKDLFI